MAFDSDVALIGTGLAPLIAASHLLSQGKSVLLLNPDFDFFLENSELPLDPLLPLGRETLDPRRIAASLPETFLDELRPYFPGPLEFWSEGVPTSGYHDADAPHVRSRSRLIISEEGLMEDLYVQASDEGWNPQILGRMQASSRFPGISQAREIQRGLLLPKLCDVDVSRYRNGLLEFIRERLGRERVICQASQIERMPGGLRFHWEGSPRTARLKEGLLVFWTPRLTAWILGQAKQFDAQPILPRGVRLWEQWSLVSRDALDPGVIGMLNHLAVWAETEGLPGSADLHLLSVLRAGELLKLDATGFLGGMSWASQRSFEELSQLCHGFLKWDRFSVRAMTPRAVLEWNDPSSFWSLTGSRGGDEVARVVAGCDGPLLDIVKNARQACEKIFGALS